jgi:acetate kinase
MTPGCIAVLNVSGISSDMRTLRQSKAAEAIALFVYRIVREIGSLAAALGGLDGVVFTAGIGSSTRRSMTGAVGQSAPWAPRCRHGSCRRTRSA